MRIQFKIVPQYPLLVIHACIWQLNWDGPSDETTKPKLLVTAIRHDKDPSMLKDYY